MQRPFLWTRDTQSLSNLVVGYFLWKLLPLDGNGYLPLQIDNWTAQPSIISSKHAMNVEGVILEGAKGKGGEKG